MKNKILIIFIFMFFICVNNAYAEETCTYTNRAEINKLAANVKFDYEFVYNESNVTGFNIVIHNLNEKLYGILEYGDVSKVIYFSDTDSGIYKLATNDIDSIIKYKLTIKTTEYGCEDTFKILSVVKPKYNTLHSYSICQKKEMIDYIYCKEWMTGETNLSEQKLLENISKKYNSLTTTTTTTVKVAETDNRNDMKLYICIAIVVLMLIDVVAIINRGIKLREDIRYE